VYVTSFIRSHTTGQFSIIIITKVVSPYQFEVSVDGLQGLLVVEGLAGTHFLSTEMMA